MEPIKKGNDAFLFVFFLIRYRKKCKKISFWYSLNDEVQNVDEIRIEYEHLMPRPAQTQEEPNFLVLPMAGPNAPLTRPGNGPNRKG